MKKLDHQNVIRLVEVIENPNTDKIYMSIHAPKYFSYGVG
jgi:hypothetical protein